VQFIITCLHFLGIHTARIWSGIDVLASYLHIPAPVVESVKEMRKAFHVLYLFDFSTLEAQHKLEWYKANIERVLKVLNVQ
jgi:hypothetical protein